MGFSKFMDKILRAGEGKKVKQLQELADGVNSLEEFYREMTDEELQQQTENFRERYWGEAWDDFKKFRAGELTFDDDDNMVEGNEAKALIAQNPAAVTAAGEQVLRDTTPFGPINGESLEQLMPEAFAAIREASRRTIGQRHFDVQLMGGAALFNGNIAEMKTGEGKTLVATLPSYLGAIAGLGVHVVTVNDYLASYQSELMGRIFRFLGLRVGCITSNQPPELRRHQYNADITYGTNNEFGFDYLRDNMAMDRGQLVQRGHFFAIVDEVDSILIDEARTPLIISGHAAGDLNAQYQDFARFVLKLDRDTDYEVDEKKKTVGVLEPGIDKLEAHLGIDNLYDAVNTPLIQFLQNAIRAKELFLRDKDYIVQNGEVKIVDEHTGRVLDGRRYNEGMHQAIEAKEGVKIQAENQTYATITLQNYFRMYKKLAGMTGTAETEAAEFMGTYNLGVIPIPTNKPMVRIDQKDFVFRSEKGKFSAIVEDVRARHESGQPVLLGTASVEKSEELSVALKRAGIPHNVLNAKQHEREASIIAMAGRRGAVTVATNMAGRGTDIMLGGNSEFLAREMMKSKGLDPEENAAEYEAKWPEVLKEAQEQVKDKHAEVADLGGLYVIGTERHESRRIDNQLRGRSGRQGDPGESRFFISMEDDLMRLFNSARAQQVMAMVDFPEDQPIENSMLTKSIQNAQAQVEGRNFEIRKNVLKYDEVMNRQRKVVYAERNKVLHGVNLGPQISTFIENTLRDIIISNTAGLPPEEWDLEKLWRELKAIYPISVTAEEIVDAAGGLTTLNNEDIVAEVVSDAKLKYAERAEFAGEKIIRRIEREVTLQVLDRNWRAHLAAMDYLREGIGLRAMAQKDPLVEYTNDSSAAFNEMNYKMQGEIVQILFNLSISLEDGQGHVKTINTDNSIVITTLQGPADVDGGETPAVSQSAPRPAQKTNTAGMAVSSKKKVQSEDNPYKGTPKNSLCPCGSGKKYKMCHGRGENS